MDHRSRPKGVRCSKLWTRFQNHQRGNVALLFAVGAAVVIGAGAAALTSLQLVDAEADLQAAADSAALAAVNLAAEDKRFRRKQREKAAERILLSNYTAGAKPDSEIKVRRQNGIVTAEISSRVEVNTPLRAVLPGKRSHVTVTSFATSADETAHTAIYFLVDNSASMGIGHTSADRDRMVQDPAMTGLGKTPCAVACHAPDAPSENTYQYYKDRNVRMRIDVMRDRLTEFLTKMNTQSMQRRHRQVAVRVTGQAHLDGDDMLHSDISGAIQEARAIELESDPMQRTTTLARPFKAIAQHMTRDDYRPGDGSRKKRPRSFVVLMTDGLENIATNDGDYIEGNYSAYEADAIRGSAEAYLAANNPGLAATFTSYDDNYYWALDNMDKITDRRLQTIAPETCDTIKSTGATLIIMNIEYGIPEKVFRNWDSAVVPYDDPSLTQVELQRFKAIEDAKLVMREELGKCASDPSLVFDADTDYEMTRAFSRIDDAIRTKSTPRLASAN